MKYLILLLVVLGLLWISRSWRGRVGTGRKPRESNSPPPLGEEDLPACAQCGVHLPRSDAVATPEGVFCSHAHRLAFLARKRGE